VSVAVLLVAGYAGWRWGEPVFTRAERWMGERSAMENSGVGLDADMARVSLEVGRDALDRVDALRTAAAGTQVNLTGAEVESILRFSLPTLVPRGVADPKVRFSGGSIRTSARVSGAQLLDIPELISRLGVIGDTVGIEIDGTLVPYNDGAVSLVVDRLQIGGVPVPGALIPRTLDALGRDRHPDLPDDAVLALLPAGLSAAWVRGDTLVLVAGGRG
jgi:hypothetical protein